MKNSEYEVILFDEQTQSYVVKHMMNDVLETLHVYPMLNGQDGTIDVPATEHAIREAVKAAQTVKIAPTNADSLIGSKGSISEPIKEI